MPDEGEAERVKRYCAQLGLAKNITFIIESSDTALPHNELIPSELDHVFIDGAHAFPAPVIVALHSPHSENRWHLRRR